MTKPIYEPPPKGSSTPAKIERFLDRDFWINQMHAASNKTLPPISKLVAAQIAFHLNISSGLCNPSHERLADSTSLHARTVRKQIARIEQAGWIKVERAHGRVNSFQLMVPDPGPLSPRVPRATVAPGGPRAFKHGTQGVSEQDPGRLSKNPGPLRPYKQGNSEENSGEQRTRAPSPQRGRGKKGPNEEAAVEKDVEAFARLCAVHPRPDGRDGAEREFNKLLREGRTTAEALVEAARRYATQRAADIQAREGTSSPDSPQYTVGLIKWLREGHWANQTNGGVTIDHATGNPIVIARAPKASGWDDIPDDWDELWRAP